MAKEKVMELIIDMINDFCCESEGENKGSLFFPESREIITPINNAINEGYMNNTQIVFVREAHTPNDPEFESFPPHGVKGTWGGQIIKELAFDWAMPVFDKVKYSGFTNHELIRYINMCDPDIIVFRGVCTSICIMDNVKDAYDLGYRTRVYKDSVADFNQANAQFALERMKNLYGTEII